MRAEALPVGLRPGGRYDEWHRLPPRYVVADVDGTLVHIGSTATPVVAEAVGAALAAGLHVGFATGRLPAGVADLAAQLRAPGPHVVHNGAQVRYGGRPLRSWPLPPAACRALVALCAERGLYGEFYADEGFVVTDVREAARPHWERVTSYPRGLVADVDLATVKVIKATIVLFDDEQRADLLDALEALGLTAGPATSPLTPGMEFVNVTSAEADKGRALAVAAAHIGCPLEAAMAVGDAHNDLTMLAVAGTAVAMGQAPPEIIAAAHLVVPEVGEDGVAHALDAAVAWRRGAPD